ncbi:type I-E CRISPR-associated protein Cse2/CasB [Streptomyces lichenis]|uniref:Type I-E CRISPR-associated protein Cse2/CasB n=1 Tax=Streptomyces lichenis TaxID=2306967 RepID=A0ABT0IDK3_9ACTN|nr:type I-E CRISPR-associated protein Cse2/CasB [Streptomyces lichenis]MCK8679407.1 type I-E CRISPR-associated protein Cse2/CasB [Streptomyces lichenis]
MTTPSAPPTASASVRERVSKLAHSSITTFQQGYLRDDPKDVAALARLRRGAGRGAGEVPDLWTLIDTGELHSTSEGDRPLGEQELTRAEDALHVALTLWAVHQQSRRTGMHQPSHHRQRPTGLGASVRRMMQPDQVDEPLRKRLVRAGAAPDLTALSQRLRDLVVLLRGEEIPLDYGLLAGQLYTWQWPGGAGTVRREWGRSFHAWHEPRPADAPPPAPPTPAD